MAGRSLVKEFSEETTCPVCLDYFTDPVTTGCGHNFCRACLTQCWGEPDKNASCPQCREPLQKSSLRPNRQLANIAEIAKKFSLREAKGTEGTGGGVCERHQEPLKLFCRDDEAPICMLCDKSKDHKEHQVILMDEAAEEYKEKIQAQLPSLEKERERLVELKVAEEQRIRERLKELEEQKLKITSIFKEMHKFLEEQERVWLTQLADLEKKIKKRQEENMTRLSEEISHFRELIKDVEEKCQQPARSLEQAAGKVSVTLDPDTAHPWLVLSEDLKTVRRGNTYQNLPNSPERFNNVFCVLSRERFTSGRHWWEVEAEVEMTKKRRWWAVGVARESLRRKGHFVISPIEGIWAVGKNIFQPHQLVAYTSHGVTFPKWTPLTLSCEPRKIRVFLDYEEGRVEFFNADTDNLIFTFTPGSFSGEGIRPFFRVQEGVSLQC